MGSAKKKRRQKYIFQPLLLLCSQAKLRTGSWVLPWVLDVALFHPHEKDDHPDMATLMAPQHPAGSVPFERQPPRFKGCRRQGAEGSDVPDLQEERLCRD